MTHPDNEGYGSSFDDDETDGPDVLHARRALQESLTNTDEITAIVAESRRLTSDLLDTGRRNHFADKWKSIIVQRGAA